MRCQVCSAEAPQGASFCQHCGAKLPMFDQTGTETEVDAERETVGQKAASPASADAKSASAPERGRRRGPVDTPEETLWEGTFSSKAMLGWAAAAGVASLVLFVLAVLYAGGFWFWLLLLAIVAVWLAVAARLAHRRLGIRYKLTNHMFYHQRGVLTRVTDRIELIEIHDVTWEQGLFDRLVNVGRIKIASGDRTDPVFYVLGVENVESVAQMIDKARRGEQVRRGRRIDFSHIDGET